MRLSSRFYLALVSFVLCSTCIAGESLAIPAGSYIPFFSKDKTPVSVAEFTMDRSPVKKEQFERFFEGHREWAKKNVKKLFADSHYLENWKTLSANAPVTDVSWFAARAYCQAQGADLPSTDQWEYAAKIHSRGLHGMHSDFREWTLDFNGPAVDQATQFCGAGAQGALDSTDAEAFERYAYRSSLKADFDIWNLGFRCAKGNSAQARLPASFPENSVYLLNSGWTRQDGSQINLSRFAGHPVVLSMIYTSCKDVCPMTIADIRKIEKALPSDLLPKVQFVLISFDPGRDGPAKLDSFAKAHALDLKRWTLLTGTEDAVRNLAAVLGLRYKKLPSGDFTHSSLITVLDSSGMIRYQQTGSGNSPGAAVDAVSRALRPLVGAGT